MRPVTQGETPHEPVLLSETLQVLSPQPGQTVLDGTCGYGGHGSLLQKALGPKGLYIGVDWDPRAIAYCRNLNPAPPCRVLWLEENYRNLREPLREHGIHSVDRVLLDLGISSPMVDLPERGFGIKHPDAPLDFRMSPQAPESGAELLNRVSEAELADILFRFGEERKSRRIARALVRAREKKPLETMGEFVSIVHRALGTPRSGGIDSSSRSAQAIRIYINREIQNLEEGLPVLFDLLSPGGRLAAISFHSLEDRQVKNAFLRWAGKCICPPELPECRCGAVRLGTVLTRKPITASPEELERNRRARSAKLRAFEKNP